MGARKVTTVLDVLVRTYLDGDGRFGDSELGQQSLKANVLVDSSPGLERIKRENGGRDQKKDARHQNWAGLCRVRATLRADGVPCLSSRILDGWERVGEQKRSELM